MKINVLLILTACSLLAASCSKDDDNKDDEKTFALQPVIPQFAAVEDGKYATGKCWPMALNAIHDGEVIGLDRDYEATIEKTEAGFEKDAEKVAEFNIYKDSKCRTETSTVTIPKHDALSSGKVYIQAESAGMAWFSIRVEGDNWVSGVRGRKEFVDSEEK